MIPYCCENLPNRKDALFLCPEGIRLFVTDAHKAHVVDIVVVNDDVIVCVEDHLTFWGERGGYACNVN